MATAAKATDASNSSIEDTELPTDGVGSRILDAAFEQFCLLGIRRSSMEDVARRAGVGRVTIYRRFDSKDNLVAALMQREVHKIIGAVHAAIARGTTVEERWVDGFVTGMRVVRQHRLLLALLSTEPETVLPLLTSKAGGGLALARTFMAQEIRRARKELSLPDSDADLLAETFARLTHSLVLTPATCLPVDDEEGARDFARRYIVPLVTGVAARIR